MIRPAAFKIAPILFSALIAAPLAHAQSPGKGYLGFYTRSNSNVLSSENAFAGVTVTRVVENSPAEAAGLKEGDIILEANGEVPADPNQLTALAESLPIGGEVKLRVERDKEVTDRTLHTVARIASAPAPEVKSVAETKRLGFIARPLSADESSAAKLKPGQGLRVTAITPKGPLARAGLAPGATITAFDAEPVYSGEELLKKIAADPKATAARIAWLDPDGRSRSRRVNFFSPPRKTRELKIPLLISYTRNEKLSKLSLPLLFLFSRERLEGATKYSLLYFIRFERGQSAELLEVKE